jgi:DNA-binding LacI/PurR family transcriptional regulator
MNAAQRTVCHHIVTGIMDGRFLSGSRLPTEHELAAKFQTNRMNVHAAMKTLERHSILHRKRRLGTFVKADFDHRNASTLRSLTANQVAILLSSEPEPHVHWNGNTLTEFERLLNKQECRVTYRSFPSDRATFETCLKELAGAGYRGVVLLPISENNELLLSCMDLIEDQPLDIYLLNRGDIPTDRCRCHMLCLDPYDEGIQVGRFIVERGWDAVTFLESDPSGSVLWVQERKAGLQEGLRTASGGRIEVKDLTVDIALTDFTLQHAAASPTKGIPVLVTQNDSLAAGLMDRARAQGWQMGRDFYVLSFDDNPQCRPHNLTTVSPPLSEMAKDLAELLVKEGHIAPRKQQIIIKLKSRLIERGTTGPHRADGRANLETSISRSVAGTATRRSPVRHTGKKEKAVQ